MGDRHKRWKDPITRSLVPNSNWALISVSCLCQFQVFLGFPFVVFALARNCREHCSDGPRTDTSWLFENLSKDPILPIRNRYTHLILGVRFLRVLSFVSTSIGLRAKGGATRKYRLYLMIKWEIGCFIAWSDTTNVKSFVIFFNYLILLSTVLSLYLPLFYRVSQNI